VCVASGIDPYVLYDVVCNGGGMAYGRYFERRARRILDGDFSPTFTAELMRKDVRLALDLARSARVPAPLLDETGRAYDETVARGWGAEDFSAVTHVVETRIGRKLSSR
jgi:3-hydroxyisobutyrate dehydrogenase